MTHRVVLAGYKATTPGVGSAALNLGTVGSYGIEQLQLAPDGRWDGMTITATFHPPGGKDAVRVLVGPDGLVNVPPEATASASDSPGLIVFAGAADGVQRISCNLPYTVSTHAAVEGPESSATPDVLAQAIAQIGAIRDEATQAADRAEEAVGKIGDSAERAEAAASRAEQAAKVAEAGAEAVEAAKTKALEAVEQARAGAVSDVETAGRKAGEAVAAAQTEAVRSVHAAQSTAETSIAEKQKQAVDAVTGAQTSAEQAIGSAKTDALDGIANAKTGALGEIETAKTDAVKAVTEEGDAQAERLQELVPEVYTKTEADARYAPISAAIRPTVSGNPAVCADSVAWLFQGLKIYGKSNQDGTPSPENPVPIVSAGEGGSVEVKLFSENLFNPENAYNFKNEENKAGVVVTIHSDGDIEFNGVQNSESNSDFFFKLAQFNELPNGDYTLKAYSDADVSSVNLYYSSESGFKTGLNGAPCVFTKKDEKISYVIIRLKTGATFDGLRIKMGLNVGSAPMSQYKPYAGFKSITLSAPSGLPGIPVTSGGNYTDSTGKQLISNIADVDAGILRENVFQETITLSYSSAFDHYEGHVSHAIKPGALFCLCDVGVYAQSPSKNGECRVVPNDQMFILKSDTPVDTCTVVYFLSDPIVTPLSTEEIAAYRALMTYDGTTVVSTDEPVAGIEARYVADGAKVIESIESRLAALETGTKFAAYSDMSEAIKNGVNSV